MTTELQTTESQQTDAKLVTRYGVTPEQIEAKKKTYAALTCDTREGYEQVRLAIAECRTTRVQVEAKRKELKAGALEYGRRVDAVAKQLTGLVEEIETPLQEKKDAVDQAKARAKAEKEAQEKAALEAQLKAEREAEEARLKAEREAEAARLAAQREAQRIEAEKLAAERRAFEEEQARAKAAAEKAAAESRAKAEEEARKLAEERRKLEEAREAEELRQRVAREQEEARLAAVRAEEEAKLDAARAEVQRQRRDTARLEAERLAKLEADRQAEVARKEAEEAAVREAERQAAIRARLDALRPDAEKLYSYAGRIRAIDVPTVASEEARRAVTETIDALAQIAGRLETFGKDSTAIAQEAAE
jgi:NADH dehydrogenase [ubiquinone] 1 alpha subcomplex assembly factor 7